MLRLYPYYEITTYYDCCILEVEASDVLCMADYFIISDHSQLIVDDITLIKHDTHVHD